MVQADCTTLIRTYVAKLGDEFMVEPTDNGCLILTPFVRPDGDAIEVSFENADSGRSRITDMGEGIGYLYVSGLSLSRGVIDDVKRVSKRFGISVEGTELIVEVDPDNLADSVHGMIQACLGVAALIEKRRPYQRLLFDNEVEALIISKGRVYDKDFRISGQKESHEIKFHVNSGRRMLIQPFSQTSEPAAYKIATSWYYHFDDILKRSHEWKCVAVLDDRGDRGQAWSERARIPLNGLVELVAWSHREPLLDTLAT